jgi:copper resistance protein C
VSGGPGGSRLRAAVLTGVAVVGLLLGTALPAAAHDVLTGTDPANGAQVAQGPERVTLTFNNPPNSGFATITVVGPGETHWERGPTTVTDNRVTVGVGPLGPAGTYEIGYRIVSSDGHPVSGESRFTLTRPGTGTPSPPPAADAASSGGSSGGLPVWPFVVVAAVIVLGALVLALRRTPRD